MIENLRAIEEKEISELKDGDIIQDAVMPILDYTGCYRDNSGHTYTFHYLYIQEAKK